jgi:hypothetical protein
MPTRHEINALVTRVLALPDLAKFEIFDALREDLAAALSKESPENRKVQERKEALVVIKKVAEELGLPANKAPTAKQFDEVVDRVAEGWNSQRVVRLWERWRLAKGAYLGTRKTDTPASRKRRKQLKGTWKQGDAHERYLASLRTWLDSEPERLTRPAYEEFAEAHNADLRVGEQPLSRVDTIRRGLPTGWENALAVARGELTMEEALEVELAEQVPKGDRQALVGIAAIAKMLNHPQIKIENLLRTDTTFPVPVARIQGHRAWLYEDVKLYKRGLATPKRTEGESQALYMDTDELVSFLGLTNKRVVESCIREKSWDRIPPPEGAIAKSYHYWKRDKVKAWQQQREAGAKASAGKQAAKP